MNPSRFLIAIHIIFKDGYKFWMVTKQPFEELKNYILNHPSNLSDNMPDKDKIVDVKLLWSILEGEGI
jgi:hypothetical protein